MSVICLIDNTEHADLAALHKYIRPLMKQETYYTLHFAKKCLGCGEPIPFKNAEQYLSQDFLDKNQIRSFLKKEPIKGRVWAIDWLRKRKEEKGLVYAPSQVELRSLQCPSMAYYETVGGYYNITKELGFIDRYTGADLVFNDISKATLIQDTREQAPIKLGLKTLVAKVDEGDYALGQSHDQGIRIERKSLGDFAGTLNQRTIDRVGGEDSAFERFDRELERAKTKGLYVVMVVESDLTTALSLEFQPQMRWSKVTAAHVFKNLRDLLVKYPLTFQAVFTDGRKEAGRVMHRIFELGAQVKATDLQWAYEEGRL
jgi:ERCC4-type nuclease